MTDQPITDSTHQRTPTPGRSRGFAHFVVMTGAGLIAGLGFLVAGVGISLCGLWGETCSPAQHAAMDMAGSGAVLSVGGAIAAGAALARRRDWKVTSIAVGALAAVAVAFGAVAVTIAGG